MFCENLCENSSNNKYREKNEVGMYKVSNGSSIWPQFRNWDPYPPTICLGETYILWEDPRKTDIICKLIIIDVFKNVSLSKTSMSRSWIFSISQSSEIRI